eukprot:265129-Rhodomonas_salina.1
MHGIDKATSRTEVAMPGTDVAYGAMLYPVLRQCVMLCGVRCGCGAGSHCQAMEHAEDDQLRYTP